MPAPRLHLRLPGRRNHTANSLQLRPRLHVRGCLQHCLPDGAVIARLSTLAVSMALAALSSASPAAAQSSVCGTAMLRDVEVVTARIPQSTITSVHTRRKSRNEPGDRQVDVYTTPVERQTRTYLVTVRLNDLVYIGESPGNEFWQFDPTRLVINDPIDACVADGRLRLRRPDAKEYKTKIVRVVRDGVAP